MTDPITELYSPRQNRDNLVGKETEERNNKKKNLIWGERAFPFFGGR